MHLLIKYFCNTPETQARGLMHTQPIKMNECAFFVFNYLSDFSFWNKNVDYDICLLFLDENFEIRDIGELQAQQEKPCKSRFPLTKYVVEGHIDLPKEHNIKVGDYCLPENNKIKLLKKGND